MNKYALFGSAMRTPQCNRLAVAGFCPAGRLHECEERMERLRDAEFYTDDPTKIDEILAAALSELYGGLALAVGACVYIEGISDSVYRTGGVLGRPEDSAEDADSDLDRLDDGMWMFTAPGGPGWISFAPQAAAEKLAQETLAGSGAYAVRVNETYRALRRASPAAYLFVSDGTGYDSLGICAARLGEKELSFIV